MSELIERLNDAECESIAKDSEIHRLNEILHSQDKFIAELQVQLSNHRQADKKNHDSLLDCIHTMRRTTKESEDYYVGLTNGIIVAYNIVHGKDIDIMKLKRKSWLSRLERRFQVFCHRFFSVITSGTDESKGIKDE